MISRIPSGMSKKSERWNKVVIRVWIRRFEPLAESLPEKRISCAALTGIQFLPNGDVLTCPGMPPVGNINERPIRRIREGRPKWWHSGCCLEHGCSEQ
jgi:hypothetical protein